MEMKLNRPSQKHQQDRLSISVDKKLEIAASRLQRDLQSIETSVTDKYLQHKLRNLESTLLRDRLIFRTAISRVAKPLQNAVLIDYGGGPGFHSLLARELGIGTVIYDDILQSYCTLAEEIATILGRQADYYVTGDIDALIQFCDQHAIKADVITSSDVLEHVYDIDDFLSKLQLLSHEGTVTVHSSGCNMFWYPFYKSVSRLHRKVENESGEDVGIQSSCYDERMKIIREHAQNMSADRLNQLAADTRGLAGREIINAVDRYLKTGERPALIEHPTNTCNPQTGYWAERSMNPYYLQETLSFNGFDAKLLAGPWERGNTPIVRIIRAVLNFLIRISPTYMALHLTYYYCILGKYNGKSSREMHREHMYRHPRSPIVYIVALPYRLLSIFRAQRDWWKL